MKRVIKAVRLRTDANHKACCLKETYNYMDYGTKGCVWGLVLLFSMLLNSTVVAQTTAKLEGQVV